MNKDNAKDYLPLVQALADGKELQWSNDEGEWGTLADWGFTTEPKRYRIKPEPREWFVWVDENGRGRFATAINDEYQSSSGKFNPVKVREVIE